MLQIEKSSSLAPVAVSPSPHAHGQGMTNNMKNIIKLLTILALAFVFSCQSQEIPDTFAVVANAYTKEGIHPSVQSENIEGYIFSISPLKKGSKAFLVLNHGDSLSLSDNLYLVGEEIKYTDVLNELNTTIPLNDSIQKIKGWKYIYRVVFVEKPSVEVDDNLLVLVANHSSCSSKDILPSQGFLKDKHEIFKVDFNCKEETGNLTILRESMSFDYFCGEH